MNTAQSKSPSQSFAKISLVLLLTLLLIFASACAAETPNSPPETTPETTPTEPTEPDAAQPESIRLIALKGPTGIGMAYLMEQAEQDAANPYRVELAAAPDEVVAAVANGSVDIAAVPSNLALNLYNKTNGQVQMLAINAYGSLYILENGESIHSLADLAGKTIYATGQGANPEYVLNFLLQANGLTPGEDVEIEFLAEHAELATQLAAGQVAIGLLPEPNVTAARLQNSDLRVAVDLTAEWDRLVTDGSKLTMSALLVNREFAAQYPAAVADFLRDIEASIDYALTEVAATAQLCEKFAIIPKAAIAEQAIPNCNLTFLSGNAMQSVIGGYFQMLYEANPQAVGGALPDEGFYYQPAEL